MNGVAVVGHRGAPLECPENTLESFDKALSLGADGVELDARLTADDEIVVCHDPVIRVPGGGEIVIRRTPLDQLARLDMTEIIGHEKWVSPTRMPTLAEVLEATAPALVDIEMKDLPHEPSPDTGHELSSRVAALVREMGAVDRVVVSSFWLEALDAITDADPHIRTGWLLIPPTPPSRVLDVATAHGFNLVLPHDLGLVSEGGHQFDQARHRGLFTWAWTVDDPARMRELVESGIDGIITDTPTELLEILGRASR